MASWFDLYLSVDTSPTPIAGRVLVDAPFPPGSGRWDVIRQNGSGSGITWLLQIKSVLPFLASLPVDMRPATMKNPESGLPKNVWVGGRIENVWPEILDIKARVRFLIVDDLDVENDLDQALGAWRCSNCGRRGLAPRPKTCPHAAHLCGDAELLPQIHWIIDVHKDAPWPGKQLAEAAGAVYWPEGIPDV